MIRTDAVEGTKSEWTTEFDGVEAFRLGPTAWVVVPFETLVHDHLGNSGEMGDPVPGAAAGLRRLKATGTRIIIDTARPEFAVRAYLEERGLPFDQVLAGPGRSPLFTVIRDGQSRSFTGEWAQVVNAPL